MHFIKLIDSSQSNSRIIYSYTHTDNIRTINVFNKKNILKYFMFQVQARSLILRGLC